MSWRPHGRARVDARNLEAFGICDDCGFLYNLNDLRYQYEWAGVTLYNTRFRKCYRCLDKPQILLKAILLPPDPLPVSDPRPENYAVDEAGSALPFPPGPVPPVGTGGYTTEDGLLFYTTEDGLSFYVPESGSIIPAGAYTAEDGLTPYVTEDGLTYYVSE